MLKVVSDPDDYLVNAVSLDVPRDDVGDILIRFRADRGSYLRLGWAKAGGRDDGQMWRDILDLRFRGHGEFHTYVINARNVLKRGLRPATASASSTCSRPTCRGQGRDRLHPVHLQEIALRRGRARARLRGEGQRVPGGSVHAAGPGRSNFASRCRNAEPRLDFGMGVLLDGRPLRFVTSLTQPDGVAVPLQRGRGRRSMPPGTTPRIDLSPWAGRRSASACGCRAIQPTSASGAARTVSGRRPSRFNVIVLVEDAQRADYLSLYGHPRDTTPFKRHLMAERGVLFERAISQATKTRPSVAAYMTWLYPTAIGLWHFSDVLSERPLTLAEILRTQGYVTASFIQNGNVGPFAGLHQGFDRLFDLSRTAQRPRRCSPGTR